MFKHYYAFKLLFSNIILMEKYWKIFRKKTLEIFRNFPEKYEIFRTIFPPHNTTKDY